MIKLSFEFDYSEYEKNIEESDIDVEEIDGVWIYRYYEGGFLIEVSGEYNDGTIELDNAEVVICTFSGDKIGEGHFVSIEFLIIKQYKIYGSINSSISQQIS